MEYIGIYGIHAVMNITLRPHLLIENIYDNE